MTARTDWTLRLRLNQPQLKRFHNLDFGWLVAFLIPFIGIASLLNSDHIIQTADGLFHVHRILAVTTLMQQGDLYPRWIPWFHLGYGYPVLNYYAPLGTYVGGLMGLVGISAPNASTLIIALSWISGSMGMYGLARRCLNAQAGVLVALLWTYAPIGLQLIWNQGSLSQMVAAGLVPWLFFMLLRVVELPTLRRVAALGLAAGLTFLAHQPTTFLLLLLIAPGVPLICLWYGRREGRGWTRLLYAVGGLGLGVGIALVFLLPMALEIGYIKVAQPAADIPQTLARTFLRTDQLFIQPSAPDLSDLNRKLPETIGVVTGVLAALGVLALLARRRWGLALVCVVGVGVILFLILPISLPVWLGVPLMAQLRFPARALHIGVVFFALLGGASLLLLPERFAKMMTLVLTVIILLAALPTVYPSREFLDFSDLKPADEIQYEVDTRSFGGTSYDEFKPMWGERTPNDVPGLADYEADPLRIHVIDPQQAGTTVREVGHNEVEVVTGQSVNVSFRQFYFPGLQVQMDGTPIQAYPEDRRGLLTVAVSSGTHTLRVEWVGTFVENLAPLLTLVSLAVMLWLWRKKEPIADPILIPQLPLHSVERGSKTLSRLTGWLLAGGMGLFALVNAVYILPRTNWFRQQSPLDSPAYMQTAVHQRFGEAYELLGYSLHTNTVKPGEALDVTLYWHALSDLTQIYQPIVQLVNPTLSAAWATSDKFFVGDYQSLHTPDYFVSDEHRLQVNEDAPPYIGRLLVKLIDPTTGAPLPLADSSTQLILDTRVRVEGEGLPVQKVMNTVIDGKLELWCASVQTGDSLTVDLYWHVLGTLPPDATLFLHGFDGQNTPVTAFDRPPLNGDYAPSDWLAGQNLVDHITLSDASAVTGLAGGFHLANGDRLAVIQDGSPAQDNLFEIPLTARECAG